MLCDDVFHILNETLQHDLVWCMASCIPVVQCMLAIANLESMNLIGIAFSYAIKQSISMLRRKDMDLMPILFVRRFKVQLS